MGYEAQSDRTTPLGGLYKLYGCTVWETPWTNTIILLLYAVLSVGAPWALNRLPVAQQSDTREAAAIVAREQIKFFGFSIRAASFRYTDWHRLEPAAQGGLEHEDWNTLSWTTTEWWT